MGERKMEGRRDKRLRFSSLHTVCLSFFCSLFFCQTPSALISEPQPHAANRAVPMHAADVGVLVTAVEFD